MSLSEAVRLPSPSARKPTIHSREAMRGSDSTKLLYKTGSNYPGMGVKVSCSVTKVFFNSVLRDVQYATRAYERETIS